jgi:REP element-mobilizing transposase RayT
MARPLRIIYPGAYYHVTSRGNEQKDIFKSQRDREKFLEYLESATERYRALIHAYCLMSNRYHLLLETPAGNLPQIMRHINGAYTTYFNVKRKRAGHLFQGRYKAILVEFDEYALELSRYIHLNPVRVAIVTKPEQYRWSSYRGYIGEKPAPGWLKTEAILEYFGKKPADQRKKYRAFVEDMLGREYESPLSKTFAASVLGTDGFIDTVKSQFAEKQADRSVPELQHFIAKLEPQKITNAVNATMGQNQKQARQVVMYLCHKYSGLKLREIGEKFEVGETAIAEARRLLERKLERDKKLRDEVEKVKKKLKI